MSYEPYPRLAEHWLLLDGSTITDPRVEATPAKRRMRIAGQDESVPRHDLDQHLLQFALRRAERKQTRVILNLGPDPSDPTQEATLINRQVGNASFREHFKPFVDNATSCSASWLFRYPGLPLFARVSLSVLLRPRYGSTPKATVSLSFPDLRQMQSGGWRPTAKAVFVWDGNPPLSTLINEHHRGAITEVLANNEVTFESREFTNAEAVMEYAIAAYRAIDSIQQVNVPDLRGVPVSDPDGVGHVGVMEFDFDRSLQPDSYLSEMVEYADTVKPAYELRDHWNSIVRLLEQRGVPVGKATLEQALHVLLGTGKAEPVTLAPYRMGTNTLTQDDKHGVTLNVYDGTVHVSCSVREPTPTREDVLAYEIAKERAAITGETDLLAAFMASIEGARRNQEVQQIIRAARHT